MTVHDAIVVAAQLHGLDPTLVEAVVIVESGGKPDAFRYENAFYLRYVKGNVEAKAAAFGPLAACSYGAMQIMLEVAVELGFTGQPWDLFDLATGLTWGAWHLRTLLDWADGNELQAVAAYNGGKGGNERPPYRNQSYVDRVVKARKGLQWLISDSRCT